MALVLIDLLTWCGWSMKWIPIPIPMQPAKKLERRRWRIFSSVCLAITFTCWVPVKDAITNSYRRVTPVEVESSIRIQAMLTLLRDACSEGAAWKS
eukprot:scaffold852_cov197-Alexandrium_tamarense.AAC.50